MLERILRQGLPQTYYHCLALIELTTLHASPCDQSYCQMPYPQLLTAPWSHVLGIFLCARRIKLEESVPESDVPACDWL